MAPAQKNPKVVTVMGRLSFPTFSAEAAYDRSQKGDYPAKSVAEAKPDFQLLLPQTQHDKLMAAITDNFLPYCIEQEKNGEKRDVLNDKEVKGLLAQLNADDYEGAYNLPVKAVSEKSAELMPEAVSTLKVIGNAGVNIVQKAAVYSDADLSELGSDVTRFPAIVPLEQSVHELYAGCWAAVTVNLYAYHNGKNPGFSAGGTVCVFRKDDEPFGGGVGVDEDEIFADD